MSETAAPGRERGGAGEEQLLERRAWAKLNLYLHITGRRADGYHTLDSLIVFAGVGDRLTFAPAERLTLELAGPFAAAVPDGPDNLVLRAASALRAAAGLGAGARIRLEKNLPAAAGLGGGSADAAATLQGLARLWSLDPDRLPLAGIAAGLGADVPVCCYGRPAFVGGIGTELERAPPLPPAWLVLANPGVGLATPEVFRGRRGGFSAPGRWDEVDGSLEALAKRLAALGNDLEAPALALAPEIGPLLAALGAAPGALLARMSGSGASCFALFAARAAARAAAEALQAAHPGWWLAAAPLLHGPLPSP